MVGHLTFVHIEHSWNANVSMLQHKLPQVLSHQDFCREPVPAAGIIDHQGTLVF